MINGGTTFKEWDAAMDQSVLLKNAYGSTVPVDVKGAVDYFSQLTHDRAVTQFGLVHNVIKTAYQCTLAKYASLTTFTVIRDMRELKASIGNAIQLMEQQSAVCLDRRNLFGNRDFREKLYGLCMGQLHSDYDFKMSNDNIFQILTAHIHFTRFSKELHNMWAAIVEKNLKLKIKYNVNTDVIRSRFANEYDDPIIDMIDELDCVLNEAIRIFDNFVMENCIRHDGNFVKNFRSLRTSFREDFMWLMTFCDNMKAGDPDLGLYTDFSKPSPEATHESDEILASGCFIEKMQFEISGLKMDLPNTTGSMETYDVIDNKCLSKSIQMTHIQTINKKEPKVGMIMFRDDEYWHDSHPSKPYVD
ncbi:uncharacterized protein LOC126843312 [Adelges cooleyi]|uniref:uncharacterized protein LOC126843312 n=1 Tax=Adelges cooleyi TaxID=133065 RepID=UPI00217FB690|nr:uncharacterized protein LOC126843312 [Adelges cooleyi]